MEKSREEPNWLRQAVNDLLKQGKGNTAVILVREQTGLCLDKSRRFVEEIFRNASK